MLVKLLIGGYVAIALLHGMWVDAMERKYRQPDEQSPMVVSLLIGSIWPISMPISMWSLLGDGGRWRR